MTMTTITREVRISGRVQGVRFRAWTWEQARDLGLAGWVRNQPDGSVRAVFHGPEPMVEAMLRALWSGPRAASVRDVQQGPADPPEGTEFVILR